MAATDQKMTTALALEVVGAKSVAWSVPAQRSERADAWSEAHRDGRRHQDERRTRAG